MGRLRAGISLIRFLPAFGAKIMPHRRFALSATDAKTVVAPAAGLLFAHVVGGSVVRSGTKILVAVLAVCHVMWL